MPLITSRSPTASGETLPTWTPNNRNLPTSLAPIRGTSSILYAAIADDRTQ
jgi:hypothetical protein